MQTTAERIRAGMAKAFFASAYADQADEAGQPLRGQIMDQLPPTMDAEALAASERLYSGIAERNGAEPDALHRAADGGLDAEAWGHYAAMQSMGHGVGLWEYDVTVQTPDIEFSGLSLSREYF